MTTIVMILMVLMLLLLMKLVVMLLFLWWSWRWFCCWSMMMQFFVPLESLKKKIWDSHFFYWLAQPPSHIFMLITLGLEQPQQRSRCFPDPRDPWNLHHRVCRLSIDLLQAECLFVRKKKTYGLMFDTYSIYTCVLMMLLWCSIYTIFINIWWYVSI